MQTLLAFTLFAVGVVLIVKGGDAFVDAAGWMAEASGIPPFIVGATVVSLATTLPEMLVSVIAARKGQVEMAAGNAIGSVTANTGLILAVAVIAMAGKAPRRAYLAKSLLLVSGIAVLLVSARGGALGAAGCLLLAGIFALFLAENLCSARAAAAKDAQTVRGKVYPRILAGRLALFCLGAAGIVAGAQLLVKYGSALAALLGVPERVIAVTIVAVGTSLPELVTTLTAILKKQASLSAGNILGANIIDTALILPLCSLASGRALPISAQCLRLDLPFCLAVNLLMLLPMLVRQRFARWQGWAALAVYGAYLWLTVAGC